MTAFNSSALLAHDSGGLPVDAPGTTGAESPPAGDGQVPAADLAECLERVRRNDQAAARELVGRLRPIVLRIVRRHLPRRETEEDMAQEVYLKVFSRLDQYRSIAPFTHWVAKIALRTCFNHLRAQRLRPELRFSELSPAEIARIEAMDAGPGWRRRDESLGNSELLRLLLSKLNAEDRNVVVLFHLEQKSIAEICAVTGWKMEFAKMRVFRARRKLRRALARLPRWDVAGIRVRPAKMARATRMPRLAPVPDPALESRAA